MKRTYRYIFLIFLYTWTTALFAQSGKILSVYHQFDQAPSISDIQQVVEARVLPDLPSGTELFYQEQRRSLGATHYKFELRYAQAPVFYAEVKAHVSHRHELRTISKSFPSFRAPEDKYTFPVDSTWLHNWIVQRQKALTDVEIQCPLWYISEGTLQPVACVRAYSESLGLANEFLLDDQGQVIEQSDLGAYHNWGHLHNGDSICRGRVFIPDPVTRAQAPYGQAFSDDNDAHTSLLESLMDTVELKGLTLVNGRWELRGPHVAIEDIAPFNDIPANSSTGLFFFRRNQSEFEDVMAYYHIDTFQRYVQYLGFDSLQNQPLRVDPHGKADSDQSVFVTNNGNSYILFGDGGVDDAEDADVIIHEYGHALSYDAAPNTRRGSERVGLDEGFGDYFAAAYSYDLSPWQWFEIFNWDGHNVFWPGREAIVSDMYQGPGNYGIYQIGAFWASIMMEIRLEIGAEITDQLALEELYSNFPDMTLADGAILLIEADSVLFGGIHTPVIQDKFCARGVILNSGCLGVSVDAEPPSKFAIYPNPAKEAVQLLLEPGAYQVHLWDLSGRRIQTWTIQASRTAYTLPLPEVAGLFILEIHSPQQEKYRFKINITP
ncbi:MAG: T9SS type A sorting domain-containing protein [Bacteroidota bacterium]